MSEREYKDICISVKCYIAYRILKTYRIIISDQ